MFSTVTFSQILQKQLKRLGESRPHAHIVANRVNIDGQCASDWLDFHRTEEILRQLEQKYELTAVASSWETQRGGDTTGQIRRQKREAELGTEPQESTKRLKI